MHAKIEWYKEVLELEPGSRVFLPLAKLLVENGEPDEAIATLQNGIERHPDHVEARLLLVDLLHARGEGNNPAMDKELDSLAALLSAHPGFWEAWAQKMEKDPLSGDCALMLSFLAYALQKKQLSLREVLLSGLRAMQVSVQPDFSAPADVEQPAALDERFAMLDEEQGFPELVSEIMPAESVQFVDTPENPMESESEVTLGVLDAPESEADLLAAEPEPLTQAPAVEHAAPSLDEELLVLIDDEHEHDFASELMTESMPESMQMMEEAPAFLVESESTPEMMLGTLDVLEPEADLLAAEPEQSILVQPVEYAAPSLDEELLVIADEQEQEIAAEPIVESMPESVPAMEGAELSMPAEPEIEAEMPQDMLDFLEPEPEQCTLSTRSMAEVLAEQGDLEGARLIFDELLMNTDDPEEKRLLQEGLDKLGNTQPAHTSSPVAHTTSAAATPTAAAPTQPLQNTQKLVGMLEMLANRLEARVTQ